MIRALVLVLLLAGAACDGEHETPDTRAPATTFETITVPLSRTPVATTSTVGAPVPTEHGTGAPPTVTAPPATCVQDADEIAAGEVPATPPCDE